MRFFSITAVLSAILSLAVVPWAWADATCLKINGKAQTNSLSSTTTQGTAKITSSNRSLKLECGILGTLQEVNPDGSYHFQHSLVCNDHSWLVLDSKTSLNVQGECSERPGIVGSLSEQSTLTGLDGPLAGAWGTAEISGTVYCGWMDMVIHGEICQP